MPKVPTSGTPDSSGLVKELAREGSFRSEITKAISALLKDPNTELSLKILTLVGLMVLVGVSFELSVFFVHAIVALSRGTHIEPFWYVTLIASKIILLMALSVPAVMKATARENALRLESSFKRIEAARIGVS